MREMTQEEVLQSVEVRLGSIGRMQGSKYRLMFSADSLPEVLQVFLIPFKIGWQRRNHGGGLIKTHLIDVVLMSRIESEMEIAGNQTCLEMFAEKMLDTRRDCALTDMIQIAARDAPCVGVETVSGAEAGYFRKMLEDTPSTYVGGIRLTLQTL